VHEAVFDGKMNPVADGEVKEVGSLKRGYRTPDQTCPDLTPSKEVQRQELADKLRGGTVLETYAGKGELSEKVYSKKADKIVALDKNKELLMKTDRRLDRKVKHEVIVSDNVKWLDKHMDPKQLEKLRLVDFDAFGSPAKPARSFFKHFPIRRKMYVALTDGSKMFLGYKKGYDQQKWLRENYGIHMKSKGTREDQIRILDAFMKAQGQVHGFNVQPINVAYDKHHAVYAGYEISPKKLIVQ
jgi:tRNA G26 N,N-dimethylase Trm1